MAAVLQDGLSISALRRMIYLVTPSESSFPTVEAVPKYVDLAIVWFFVMMGLELLVCFFTDQMSKYKANDFFTSVGGGLIQSCAKVLTRSCGFALYCQIYDHYHLVDLPWNSKWIWLASFIGVDFAYYWFHRFGHESMIGWSVHQMHHSSEYYNLSTALRQGMVQEFVSMWFYFPMAFFIPPPIHLVHTMLNLIYQFWIHTEMIDRLGPLELIINTPSHHRVHHGRNPYCIDKNYGGTLILWDRLFGTFRNERKEEPVVYGLVHPVSSFNQLYCQLFVLKATIWDKPRSLKGWWNKIQTPWRGPGWEPGIVVKDSSDGIPEIKHPVKRYNPEVPVWINVYVTVHFTICVLAYLHISAERERILAGELFLYVLFVTYSLQCFGAFFDNKSFAGVMELARCLGVYLALTISKVVPVTGTGLVVHGLFALSTSLWLINLINSVKEWMGLKQKEMKTEDNGRQQNGVAKKTD